MLGTLSQYLSGNENLKKVMNSPALDHFGKLLSRDGQKVFAASNNFNRRGNRPNNNRFNNKRGNGDGNNQKGKKGKNKGSNQQVCSYLFEFINSLYFLFRNVVNPRNVIPMTMVNTGVVSIRPVAVTILTIVS